MVSINFHQAKQILEMFGGEDAEVSIWRSDRGHSGPGLYANYTEYPEEGCIFIEEEPENGTG